MHKRPTRRTFHTNNADIQEKPKASHHGTTELARPTRARALKHVLQPLAPHPSSSSSSAPPLLTPSPLRFLSDPLCRRSIRHSPASRAYRDHAAPPGASSNKAGKMTGRATDGSKGAAKGAAGGKGGRKDNGRGARNAVPKTTFLIGCVLNRNQLKRCPRRRAPTARPTSRSRWAGWRRRCLRAASRCWWTGAGRWRRASGTARRAWR